jgi:Flp pilus assembly protein TadG
MVNTEFGRSMVGRVDMETERSEAYDQSGQSIVLVALLFVILLLFVGLAVDVGFGFVRSSEFSRSVDSATLAGVIDLDLSLADCTADPMALTCPANVRAQQFLASNGWPISQTTRFDSAWSYTQYGTPQYTITVTYPVETYFLRLLGIGGFPVTHGASAAYNAQTDVYVPTSLDDGQIRKASPFMVGPDGCAETGDPVVPVSADNNGGKAPNPDYLAFDGIYTYRVRVPPDYITDTIRIELFDPDSVNRETSNTVTVFHSDAYSITHNLASEEMNCSLTGEGEPCVLNTGESQSGPTVNPVWLHRVDEYFDSACNATNDTVNGNTQTIYELYTLDENGTRQNLAKYTWNYTADPVLTDLKWVTPGVTPGVDVDSDAGYLLTSFDVPFNVLPDNGLAPRYVYMDVYPTDSNGGSSRNVWDISAGPPAQYYAGRGLPSPSANANDRNLQLANHPGQYDTLGITVAAIGRLPIDNHIVGDTVSFTLAPVGELTTQAFAYMTLFDYENPAGSPPPPDIVFGVDSDLGGTFGSSFIGKVAEPNPNPGEQVVYCNGGSNCDNLWTDPNFIMKLPNDPNLGFGGGSITAEYQPNGDAHTWWLTITAGRPFLTR